MTSKSSIRPADRISTLKLQQTLKMARSAHAYVRGSTVKFYEWLEQQKRGTLPEGPPVWICGDCHVGNLGPVAAADGRVDIQIRDLDQTSSATRRMTLFDSRYRWQPLRVAPIFRA